MLINEFSDVDKLSDKDFELFVKDLLLDSGWNEAEITEVGKEYKYGDGGVDIFAYKKGRKYAVEVKQRGVGATVDTKALNQLVTGARLAKTNNMILVTNSYFTSEVRVRSLRLGVELLDRDELQNLWIKRNSEIGREIKPRKYQIDIIDESVEQYNNGNDKILIEMATGLGKTYTVALLLRRLMQQSSGRQRVLFVSHQVEILFQSVTAFKNIFGIGTYSFSACFDGASPEDTDFVFATFDTLYTKLEDLDCLGFNFVVIDEAHHTPAKTYSQVVHHFSPKLLIGLTATPFRADNKSVIEFFGGPNGHIGKYDLAWALKHGKLAFPRYLVYLDDIEQTKLDRLEKGVSVSDLDSRLFLHKKDEEIVSIIERTIDEKKISAPKAIVFCRSITHLKHFLGFFPSGAATFVHSKMKDHQRRENLRSFREGSCRYILVCDLFNEGIDIPETNILVFMRRTASKTIWFQQLGRGLRKTENKDCVYVLDFVGSIERLMEVKQLSTRIKNIKVDPDNLDFKEVSAKEGVVHDGTIEVCYNDSAARILELLNNLRYRLATRELMLDELRSYYRKWTAVPELSQLEDQLGDVSVDQIATYFDSYFGYISAAIGSPADISRAIEKLKRKRSAYIKQHGVEPTSKALSLTLGYGVLPYFTESEINHFLGGIVKGGLEIEEGGGNLIDKSFHEPFSLGDDSEKEVVDNEARKSMIIKKYKDKIAGFASYKSLTENEKKEIEAEFNSSLVFLAELKRQV